ncbi:DUF4124 domain-containing protein [uncultured Thiothrix sp.]|uniref:DUF4124 domain-containing protein n=1 Tax=uncultured Thiothrix sp. TaxID=223185 RepID=UPI00261A1DD5|nr:DUF4124 domain-containing protein [uncultured Thiothrix sp.]
MKTTVIRLCALSALLSCMIANVQAEIYKWTDASGAVHYTQTPPPDLSKAKDIAEDISLSTGKATHATKTDTAKSEEQDKDKPKDEMEQAKDEGAKNEEKHRQFCDQQKGSLKQLLANPIIRWRSTDNVEKILTAKERADKIAEVEKNVKELCNADVLPAQASKAQ